MLVLCSSTFEIAIDETVPILHSSTMSSFLWFNHSSIAIIHSYVISSSRYRIFFLMLFFLSFSSIFHPCGDCFPSMYLYSFSSTQMSSYHFHFERIRLKSISNHLSTLLSSFHIPFCINLFMY